jgi:hypothetical protein
MIACEGTNPRDQPIARALKGRSMTTSNIPIVPASFFGMVLGLAGLGGA